MLQPQLTTLCDEFSSYCFDLGFSLHLEKMATDFLAQSSTMFFLDCTVYSLTLSNCKGVGNWQLHSGLHLQVAGHWFSSHPWQAESHSPCRKVSKSKVNLKPEVSHLSASLP